VVWGLLALLVSLLGSGSIKDPFFIRDGIAKLYMHYTFHTGSEFSAILNSYVYI
jgi:hypothetical protein